jgi:hypothetical protein
MGEFVIARRCSNRSPDERSDIRDPHIAALMRATNCETQGKATGAVWVSAQGRDDE